MRVQLTCAVCGVSFTVTSSVASRRKHCSKACMAVAYQARTGPSTTGWRGGMPAIDRGGYLTVSTTSVPGQRMQYVHRLVWEAAHGPIPAGHHVHHVNGVKTDNRLENLTLLGHADHARLHQATKLTETDVRAIRTRYAAGGITHVELGREYAINPATVTRILQRKKWRHIE